MMAAKALVEMRGISKRFGGVHALENVSLELYPGEVLGLVGHNGAGKSTLVKILCGALHADEGEIYVNGERAEIRNPRDAKTLGIETIHQTLALADNLTAPANVFLGRELKGRLGMLEEEMMERETRGVLNRLGFDIKTLKEPVKSLSGGQRQAVAISRAVYFNARVLIMDEPTAALGPKEKRKVAELVQRLKGEGLGILLISHDIHDVFDLTDRISVLYNGRLVDTCRTSSVDKDAVLGMIILGTRPEGQNGLSAAS
jgi:D-xylose transport system ATP-binding protein